MAGSFAFGSDLPVNCGVSRGRPLAASLEYPDIWSSSAAVTLRQKVKWPRKMAACLRGKVDGFGNFVAAAKRLRRMGIVGIKQDAISTRCYWAGWPHPCSVANRGRMGNK
jgi:hypothetical protein